MKVLFSRCAFSNKEIEYLAKEGIEIIEVPGDLNENALIDQLKKCEGYIIGGSDKATKKVIESCPNLKFINFYGTGWENYVDIETANQKGIIVANTPKANAYTVAEHTVALILDAVKKITYLNNTTKEGQWLRRQAWNLENRTIGIVGMGTIGGFVAKILHNGFGMNVLYFSRTSKTQPEQELGAKKVELDELFSNSDIISIHANINQETKNLITEKELSLMKPHAVLVNASLAEIVDPQALKTALESNKLATAAYDAYYIEPSPTKENDQWGLLSLPDNKFILTPHTAYSSEESVINMNKMLIEDLIAFKEGKTIPYRVN